MTDKAIEGLTAYFRRIDAISSTATKHQILGLLGLTAVAEAKRLEAPHRKTGNLGRTIRVGTITDDSVEILAGGPFAVGYAAYLEFGTRPHDIVPKNRKALRWATGAAARLSGTPRSGAPVNFATRVHHPGTRPHPYLQPGAEEALRKADVKGVMVTAWNKAS